MQLKKRKIGSFTANENGSSYYLSVRRENNVPLQIRLSNHGTYLKTWVDRTNLQDSKARLFDPSHSINISIVFVDDESDLTKDCPDRKDCEDCTIQPCVPQTFKGQNELGHPFTVRQYCYHSSNVRNKYINGFVKAIAEAITTGEYKDPLAALSRAAKVKDLTSSAQESYLSIKNQIMESRVRKIIKETIADVLMETRGKYGSNGYGIVKYNKNDSGTLLRTIPYSVPLNEATINGRTYMTKKMMGKWECIDGMYGDYDFSEYGKGDCQDVRMYMDTTVSRDECGTICLFRREDTGKYFYCEIVKAPEKGANQTKFSLLPRSKVPKEIRSDFRTLPLPPERVLASPSWRKMAARSHAR